VMRKALVVLGLLATIIGVWELTYPDKFDPKNPHYVAWKWHLLPMDPMRALGTMHGDVWPDRFVLGKTENELNARFGFTKSVSQVGTYLREICAPARPGATVLFLNDSNWMVVMKDGRASELVNCKG